MTRIWVFCWAWFHYAKYRIKPVCKFSLKGVLVSYLVSLAALLVFGSIAVEVVDSGSTFDTERMEAFRTMNPFLLFVAGIEDFIFVLPIFLLPARYQLIGLVLSSTLFTLGHSYQGEAMYAKLVTVPIVFLLARKYGIFSTAFAHGLNDVIAVALMQYLYKKYPSL